MNDEAFEQWWKREGISYDPDTSDVPWFDKRKELARKAFGVAMSLSANYTADAEVSPSQVTFGNGRTVRIDLKEDCLIIGQQQR